MSKFIDKLNRVAKGAAQPIGFRSVQQAAPKSGLLLVLRFNAVNEVDLADYASAADAVLVKTDKHAEARSLKKMAGSLPEIPWGALLTDPGEKVTETLVEAGADFTVFSADSPLHALPEESKIGNILQVDRSISEYLLRAANDISVDAVLVENGEGQITWNRLMLLERFAALLTKPLLVSIPSNVTANDLRAIWSVGVDGVVAETGGQKGEGTGALRQAIDALASLPPRKRGKMEARLPVMGRSAEVETEEEEEDDE